MKILKYLDVCGEDSEIVDGRTQYETERSR